jgi:hypothetical protein
VLIVMKLGAECDELQQTHSRQSTSLGRCRQRHELHLEKPPSINYSNPDTGIRAPNATVPYLSPSNQSGGSLEVSFSNWASPLSSWAQLAFRGLGIADAHSLIEGELIGSQYCPLTINPLDQNEEFESDFFPQ